ncbi:redoxin family protein [Mucilaginibacter myungsuensis]|uniref:Redoxin family protein n=1 Tax=Mucilaginibacter myungsuensis TaxID=649104 RepID=A0A929KTW0_9SPHI|nr:redoxin family protein [Mucilaginibacter myungsuensis]MBE9661092.1 redoxin family protein [Mucilaginibacter myungsuensis]MDN3597236.1 redoxin family protein [Mucilaginibacter myungsuensis]
MKKALRIFVLILGISLPMLASAQSALTITPEKPERGQVITITYRPGSAGAAIPAGAQDISLVFTYSTFYELPFKLPLTKNGDVWTTTFKLQRYATFATFYVQSGMLTDKPAADQHYAIPVYDKGKRVKSSQLHESYSLSAQLGKSPLLRERQRELILAELEDHPDNYEAQVRLVANSIAGTKDAAERKKLYNESDRIIANYFAADPTNMGRVNSTTMGYLIMGQSSRVDSVHKVVLARYPTSDVAMDLLPSSISKEKDTAKRILKLEHGIAVAKDKKGDGVTALHSELFDYYAARKNTAKALYHARFFRNDNSPHRAKTLKDIAETLTRNHLAPDTALKYAEQAYQIADQFPVGVIRYFPEFGYIPGYVADSTRALKVKQVKANLLSAMAINHLSKKNNTQALKEANEASALSDDKQTLINTGYVYEHLKMPDQAHNAYWKILLNEPSDSSSLAASKRNYLAYKGSDAGYQEKLDQLSVILKVQMRTIVKKEVLNLAGPQLNALTDLQGKPVTADQLKGKIVIMDFWATWCVPCMEELPYLQKVYDQYKNNPKVMFMVINSGARNTIVDAQKWGAEHKQYSFPLYFNNDPNIGEKVGFTLIPTIAVLDADGKMQFRTVGFEGMVLERKLSAQIDLLLEKM